MTFTEVLGMFFAALVVFLILSYQISATFTSDNPELVFVGAWISGSVIYALTVVGMI